MNNTIGNIILESSIGPVDGSKVTNENLNGKAIGIGILQTANEKNRNGRYYPDKELFPQLESSRLQELLRTKNLLAELGHPMSKDLQRQATIDGRNVCARFLTLWVEGFDIWAKFVGTNNDYGRSFDLDLKEGVLPAWSLRALGSVQQTRNGLEVRNLRIITWDQVIYPSHPGAYTQRVISESTIINKKNNPRTEEKYNDYACESKIIPVDEQSLVSFIESQSENIKYVKELCDFMYESIDINKNGSQVKLRTNGGDVLSINLEKYVHNEIMNYSDKFSDLY
jgi:hypothetical protein